MSNVSVLCFLASYAVAFGLELTRLLRRSAISRVVMLLFGMAGLTAHTFYLFQRFGQTNLPPLLSSPQDWMLVLAWLAVVFYLFLTTFDRDLAVGLFLLPVVLVCIGASYFVSSESNHVLDALRGWKMLHASLLVFGMAGVIVGFVLSLMYLFQHRRLKHKQTLQEGLRLPSLERLARWNWWSVMVSVPLLTLGMATGVGLALAARGGEERITLADPFVIGSGVVWLLMISLFVWLLTSRQPMARQVAWLTIWAFGFMLVTLAALQILAGNSAVPLESWHAHRPAPVQRSLESVRFHPPLPLGEGRGEGAGSRASERPSPPAPLPGGEGSRNRADSFGGRS